MPNSDYQKLELLIKGYHEESKRQFEEYHIESKNLFGEYRKDSKRHVEAVLEGFRENVKVLKELIPSIPTEERMRQIVHEEMQPLATKVDLCVSEIGGLNIRVGSLETKVDKLETKVDKLDTKVSELEDGVGELKNTVGRLGATLATESRAWRKVTESHDRRISRLELKTA